MEKSPPTKEMIDCQLLLMEQDKATHYWMWCHGGALTLIQKDKM